MKGLVASDTHVLYEMLRNCDFQQELSDLALLFSTNSIQFICWLFFRINVDLAIFQPYLDLEAGDNQSLKIQVARWGIEPRSSCSASQELYHSATTAPLQFISCMFRYEIEKKRNVPLPLVFDRKYYVIL